MTKCKDCVHYELCKYNAYQEAHYFGKDKEIYISIDNNSACKFFKFTNAVEVVHCKDCIFSHRDYDYELGYTCEKPLYHPQIGERPHRKLMQDCDFCSFGVRKDRE